MKMFLKRLKAYLQSKNKESIDIKYITYQKEILTIYYEDSRIDKYYGSCTVWHKLPELNRCDTQTEIYLSDLWTKIQFNKKQKKWQHSVKH